MCMCLSLSASMSDLSASSPEKSQGYRPTGDSIKTIKLREGCCRDSIESFPTELDTVKFNIGGTKFQTFRSTLGKIPDTLLMEIAMCNADFCHVKGAIFFDRNPAVFGAVLDCLRNGTLHLPDGVCSSSFLEELRFWRIPESYIASCCLCKIASTCSDKDAAELIEKEMQRDDPAFCMNQLDVLRGCKLWQMKAYLFLEYPNYSISALVWAIIYNIILLLSIVIQGLETCKMFHVVIPDENTNGTTKLKTVPPDDVTQRCPHSPIEGKDSKEKYRSMHFFFYLNVSMIAFFILELLFRLLIAPSKRKFFCCLYNLIDFVTNVSLIVMLAIIEMCAGSDHAGCEYIMYMAGFCKVMRVIRILKLSRCFTGLKVLLLVFKRSLSELLTLMSFLIVGMLMFATMIYYAEIHGGKDTYPNIPLAYWWSLVTMTTVGYGDFYPTTAPGYVIAILCAISGIVITGLAIPILGNNFAKYYDLLVSYKAKKVRHELQRAEADTRRARASASTIANGNIVFANQNNHTNLSFSTMIDDTNGAGLH